MRISDWSSDVCSSDLCICCSGWDRDKAMGRDSDNDQRREACHAEALAWRVRLTEDPVQATQGLEDWLARDPAHADAWHEVQDLWGLFGEHATAPEATAARRRPAERRVGKEWVNEGGVRW